MSHALFSGTLTATTPDTEMTAGPQENHTFEIDSLYLMNSSGSTAAVTVYKLIGTYHLEVYNDSILAGEAAEVNNITLEHGQALYVSSNQLIEYSAFGTVTSPIRVPENDVTFNCLTGSYDGVLIVETEIDGDLLFTTIQLDDEGELGIELQITGQFAGGTVVDASDDEDYPFIIDLQIDGEAVVVGPKGNWIGWSKIGEASFRADMVNDAGFMQMPWTGWVYAVKQLGKNIVVYGSGGVALLYPATAPSPTYGMQEFMRIGVLNKYAIAGDLAQHYWLDKKSRLWTITSDGPQKLDYEEYFSELTNPVLSFDPIERWLYVSDSTKGYVLTSNGLGGGLKNITGLDYVDDDLLAAVNDAPVLVIPEICTGHIDFGYRGMKTIEKVYFGMDTDQEAVAAVDYKYDKDTDYVTSEWTPVTPEGVAHIKVAGTDFKVRLKLLATGFCELSYINIHYRKVDYRYSKTNRGINYGDATASA